MKILTDADFADSPPVLKDSDFEETSVLTDADFEESELPRRSIGQAASDIGVAAMKGVVGLPQGLVGLLDIPTAGRVGKAIEEYTPIQFKETQAALEGLYSPQQQEAQRNVQQAEGFMGKVGSSIKNPSTIIASAIESAPSMLVGGGIGRNIAEKLIKRKVAEATARMIGAGAGEGIITAGQNVEQVREQTDTGILTPQQVALLSGSSILTGVIGALGSKLATRMGVPDIDLLMAGNKAQKGSVLKAIIGGAISEGAFEELPQSWQEQIAQNIAQDKPWDEGVTDAAVQGMMAGGLMGAVGGGGAVAMAKPDRYGPPQKLTDKERKVWEKIQKEVAIRRAKQQQAFFEGINKSQQPVPSPAPAPEQKPVAQPATGERFVQPLVVSEEDRNVKGWLESQHPDWLENPDVIPDPVTRVFVKGLIERTAPIPTPLAEAEAQRNADITRKRKALISHGIPLEQAVAIPGEILANKSITQVRKTARKGLMGGELLAALQEPVTAEGQSAPGQAGITPPVQAVAQPAPVPSRIQPGSMTEKVSKGPVGDLVRAIEQKRHEQPIIPLVAADVSPAPQIELDRTESPAPVVNLQPQPAVAETPIPKETVSTTPMEKPATAVGVKPPETPAKAEQTAGQIPPPKKGMTAKLTPKETVQPEKAQPRTPIIQGGVISEKQKQKEAQNAIPVRGAEAVSVRKGTEGGKAMGQEVRNAQRPANAQVKEEGRQVRPAEEIGGQRESRIIPQPKLPENAPTDASKNGREELAGQAVQKVEAQPAQGEINAQRSLLKKQVEGLNRELSRVKKKLKEATLRGRTKDANEIRAVARKVEGQIRRLQQKRNALIYRAVGKGEEYGQPKPVTEAGRTREGSIHQGVRGKIEELRPDGRGKEEGLFSAQGNRQENRVVNQLQNSSRQAHERAVEKINARVYGSSAEIVLLELAEASIPIDQWSDNHTKAAQEANRYNADIVFVEGKYIGGVILPGRKGARHLIITSIEDVSHEIFHAKIFYGNQEAIKLLSLVRLGLKNNVEVFEAYRNSAEASLNEGLPEGSTPIRLSDESVIEDIAADIAAGKLNRFQGVDLKSLADFIKAQEPKFAAKPDENAHEFYSQLRRVLTNKMPARMSVKDLKNMIDPNKGLGIKKDEVFWSGLEDYLAMKQPGDMVTKDEVLAAIKDVTFKDVWKGEDLGKLIPNVGIKWSTDEYGFINGKKDSVLKEGQPLFAAKPRILEVKEKLTTIPFSKATYVFPSNAKSWKNAKWHAERITEVNDMELHVPSSISRWFDGLHKGSYAVENDMLDALQNYDREVVKSRSVKPVTESSETVYRPAVRLKDGRILFGTGKEYQGIIHADVLASWDSKEFFNANKLSSMVAGTGAIGPDGYYYEKKHQGDTDALSIESVRLDKKDKSFPFFAAKGDRVPIDGINPDIKKGERPFLPSIVGNSKQVKTAPARITDPDYKIMAAIEAEAEAFQYIFPSFQGNKKEMAVPVTRAIRQLFSQEERDAITVINDYFGGGGNWGTFMSLSGNFKNAKTINIYEMEPDRMEKIIFFHTKGDKFMDILRSSGLYDVIRDMYVIAAKTEHKTSGSTIGRKVEELKKSKQTWSKDERAILQAIIDHSANDFNTKKASIAGGSLDAFLDAVARNANNARDGARRFNNAGGNFVYKKPGDSFILEPVNGKHILSLVDVPYIFTKGYSGGKVGVPEYKRALPFFQKLKNAGNSIIYTDEAYWYKKDLPTEPDVIKEALAITKSMYNMFSTFDTVEEKITGRYETIGVINGYRSTQNQGNRIIAPVESEQREPVGEGNRRVSEQPGEGMAGRPEGEGVSIRGRLDSGNERQSAGRPVESLEQKSLRIAERIAASHDQEAQLRLPMNIYKRQIDIENRVEARIEGRNLQTYQDIKAKDLDDYVILGAIARERGYTDFDTFSEYMISEYGKKIEPYLAGKIWPKSKLISLKGKSLLPAELLASEPRRVSSPFDFRTTLPRKGLIPALTAPPPVAASQATPGREEEAPRQTPIDLTAPARKEGAKIAQPMATVASTFEQKALKAQEQPPEDSERQEPGRPLQDVSEMGPTTVSIKNAKMEEERRAAKLPPLPLPGVQHREEAWDMAMQRIENDPEIGSRLVESLKLDMRPVSNIEDAILTHETMSRKYAQVMAQKAVSEAKSADERAVAKMRLEKARDDFDDLSRVVQATGTASGRGLEARKMFINEDYSLVRLEADYRADVNDGQPLSPEQEAKLKRAATEIERLQVLWDEYELNNTVSRSKTDALIEELVSEISALKKEIASMEEGPKFAAKERKGIYDGRLPKFAARTQPERLTMLKKRLAKSEMELQQKMLTRDFEPKKKLLPIELDMEAITMKYNLDAAKRRYNEMKVDDMMKKRSAGKKLFDRTVESMNFSRALMTSWDLSAPLRQGSWLLLAHPVKSMGAMKAMFRAALSKQSEYAVMQEIRSRTNAPLYDAAGLELVEQGSTLSQMEEAYMSRWVDKIPRIFGGGIVRGSQRAYITFLNRQRADIFDSLVKSLGRNGKVTLEEAKAIANYVNVATGRGNLGKHANAAATLATLFFAPRLVLSRFQLLTGQPMFRGSARSRIMMAKEYARYMTSLGIIFALAMAAGADVDDDPTSADFGKIRFGKTRIDMMSGLSQAAVFMGRTALGKTTKDGVSTPIRGEGTKYGNGWGDVLFRFVRSKLSPASGAAWTIFAGKDYMGKPATVTGVTKNLLVPMSFGDVLNSMTTHGVPEATALSLLTIFGAGVKTYENTSTSMSRATPKGAKTGLMSRADYSKNLTDNYNKRSERYNRR